jgi:hypothetical protein
VTAPPVAIAFFDPDRDIYATARSGATILFRDRKPEVLPEGPEIEAAGGTLRASLPDALDLELVPVLEPLDLGGVSARVCRVRGTAGGTSVDCLGTVSETSRAPVWEELRSLRSISALVDEAHGFLALARRPAGTSGHGQELVSAWLVDDGRAQQVEDARISTVYDGGGRQRSAGLELWMPGEEWPRRGSGVAVAGSSLELEALDVHTAVFHWRLDGRDGAGAYELMVKPDAPRVA